jgi:hypothetical protein
MNWHTMNKRKRRATPKLPPHMRPVLDRAIRAIALHSAAAFLDSVADKAWGRFGEVNEVVYVPAMIAAEFRERANQIAS